MLLDVSTKELLPFAYNILGSYQDAKDVIQDVMLERLRHADVQVENEKAYLVRAVINRAINLKNKQSKKISFYPGTWLPEPVSTDSADSEFNQKEILSYSLMVLMEKLDVRSRAVFILKEAFDYDHEEIASVLGISAQHSRKILSRARNDLKAAEPMSSKPIISPGYLENYITIIRSGDTKRLEALLHEEIISSSDGGGKAAAARQPVIGKESVLRFLSGIYRKILPDGIVTAVVVNHQPALLYFENGRLETCQIFELHDEQVIRTYFMRNPDKLSMLEATLNIKK
jgi:RNA polymerase sigma factor (sigma-70 family)